MAQIFYYSNADETAHGAGYQSDELIVTPDGDIEYNWERGQACGTETFSDRYDAIEIIRGGQPTGDEVAAAMIGALKDFSF